VIAITSRELQQARERTEHIDRLEHELQQVNWEVERLKVEVKRPEAEREFYSKRVVALEEQNRQLPESATKYSFWGQKPERPSSGSRGVARLNWY
jgi:hypothetical protein